MKTPITLTIATLMMALLGATPAAALPYLVLRGLDTCGGVPRAAAVSATDNGIVDDPVGIDNCPLLCDKWVTACKGAVDASATCWKNTLAKFAVLQAAVCNVQSGAAKEACKDTLAADKAVVKESYIDESREDGRLYCETTGLYSCTIDCN